MMKRYIKQAIVAVVFLLYLGISIGISAEPIKADVMDEDYIPEENLANAELIPINVEVQKEHNIRTEKEFIYRFQITEPGLVQIELKNSAPGENLEGYVAYYYYLHLSSGIRDCTEDWIYNKDENSCSQYVGLGVGEYYVRVIASENNTVGAYSIKINYQKTDEWEKENNNTPETATELKLNKTYNGNMYYRHTVDYYKIVLEQDTVISVSLKHKGDEDSWGKTCIRFYFYMPDDLKTPYYKYGLAGAETHEISDLGLPAGTYYIKIEEEYDSDDDYEIRVDGKKNPAWESELNDTHETAENIKTGKRYYGSVITSSDLDFYKFEVKKDGYITINMKHNFPIHFQVRDGQANMYYEKLISETGKDFTTSKIELKKGTYYLGLCAATMYSKGTYSFLIKEKAVSQKAPIIVKAESLQYNRIQLTWKKTDGAERYEIYRSTSKNGTYKKVYTTKNGTTTVWTDKNVKTGKTYYYKMKSVVKINKTKKSPYSKIKSVKCLPAKPEVTLQSAKKNQIKVSWKKVSGASGYEVYRASSKSGKYEKVTTIKKGKNVSYTDKKLRNNKRYYYKVRAYRTVNGKKVFSNYSEIMSIKTRQR